MRRPLYALALLSLSASPLIAQSRSTSRWLDNCERDGSWRNERERYCTVREDTITTRSTLRIDGRENGGITVIGSDRANIVVISKIQAQGESEREAKELADQIRVELGDEIRANGPSTRWRSSWSVSYEVHVPRRIALDLTANNGGIAIENIDGRVEFETSNGGVSLSGLSGNVRGSTSNGGVDVTLTGSQWSGDGMDVRTTNGGVEVDIPRNYSARLETGTVNGGLDIGFPITVQGRIDRRLTTQLGQGGSLVRVMTTNGGVRLRQQ